MAVPTVRSTVRQAPASGIPAHSCLDGPAVQPSPAFDDADPWIGQLALSLSIEARTLAEFGALMFQQGFKLEMSRLFLDLVYAYRQLAIAHSLGIPRLRTLALELFEACQRLDQRRRQLSEHRQPH
jgi:hypothetical protein